MRLLPAPVVTPPFSRTGSAASSAGPFASVADDRIQKPLKSALKNPLLPTVTTNVALEDRIKLHREIKESVASQTKGAVAASRSPLKASVSPVRSSRGSPIARTVDEAPDEDLFKVPSQAAVRRFLDEKYKAKINPKSWFSYELPDVTGQNIRNSFDVTDRSIRNSSVEIHQGRFQIVRDPSSHSLVSRQVTLSSASFESIPESTSRRVAPISARRKREREVFLGGMDFLGRRTPLADHKTDRFGSNQFAENLDRVIEESKVERERRMRKGCPAGKAEQPTEQDQNDYLDTLLNLASVSPSQDDSHPTSPHDEEDNGAEEEEEVHVDFARRASSEVMTGESGSRLKRVELVANSPGPPSKGRRRPRRVSITITEQVIEPGEDVPQQAGAENGDIARSGRQRRASRRMSVISVNELEILDEVLVTQMGEMEGKVPKKVAHYLRIKSILKSAQITCPTTMRAHMVRYNREPHLQQFALIGLELALAQLEGGREEFFGKIFPSIIERATMVTQLFRTGIFPTLRKGIPGKLALSRVQISSILANLFLCALPNNDFSFSGLLCSQQSYQVSKLLFFINYFRRLSKLPLEEPKGTMWFVRTVLESKVDWSRKPISMLPLRIHEAGSIDDAYGTLQVDFSHKEVGGGLLFRGSGEEEMRFSCAPEMGVAMIVSTTLDDNEALVIKGAERYSACSGSGFSFGFAGDFVDPGPRESDGAMATTVVAIDPMRFDRKHRNTVRPQLERAALQRELDKAFLGFSDTPDQESQNVESVATGLWGCGTARGNPEVKVILQWMAATTAGKEMDFFCEDRRFRQKFEGFRQRCVEEDVTVEAFWGALVDLGEFDLQNHMVFDGVEELLFGKGNIGDLNHSSPDALARAAREI